MLARVTLLTPLTVLPPLTAGAACSLLQGIVPGPKYEIQETCPADVRQDLQRVWEANLTVRGSVQNRYAWLYEQAPDLPPAVFTMTADGEVVGTAGVGVRRYQVGDRDVRAGLLGDLAMDEPHRKLLPALRLMRHVKKHTLANYDFAYGYPNAKAEALTRRAGYQDLGRLTRYARVLRHAEYADRLSQVDKVPPALAEVAQHPAVAKLAGAIADIGRLAMDAPRGLQAVSRYKLEWLDTTDNRIDDLWQAVRHDYPLVSHRSDQFLRWRYPAEDPCKFVALVERKSGELRAYALVQIEDGTAHLRDLFGHLDSFGPLLDLLIPTLYAHGATSASFRYLGSPRVVELFTARGFAPRDSSRMVIYALAPSLEHTESVVKDPESWHICDLDEDA